MTMGRRRCSASDAGDDLHVGRDAEPPADLDGRRIWISTLGTLKLASRWVLLTSDRYVAPSAPLAPAGLRTARSRRDRSSW